MIKALPVNMSMEHLKDPNNGEDPILVANALEINACTALLNPSSKKRMEEDLAYIRGDERQHSYIRKAAENELQKYKYLDE